MKTWMMATPELRKAREKRKSSIRELLEIVNAVTGMHYSVAFFSRVETRQHPIELEQAVEIARVLKRGVNDLFISKERFAEQNKGDSGRTKST